MIFLATINQTQQKGSMANIAYTSLSDSEARQTRHGRYYTVSSKARTTLHRLGHVADRGAVFFMMALVQ